MIIDKSKPHNRCFQVRAYLALYNSFQYGRSHRSGTKSKKISRSISKKLTECDIGWWTAIRLFNFGEDHAFTQLWWILLELQTIRRVTLVFWKLNRYVRRFHCYLRWCCSASFSTSLFHNLTCQAYRIDRLKSRLDVKGSKGRDAMGSCNFRNAIRISRG